MTRTRSEYLLGELASWTVPTGGPDGWTRRPLDASDREDLATLLLDAYRGTIDDEGEDHDAALVAIDDSLGRAERAHSGVLEVGGAIVAISFVVEVGGRPYVDPVATASSRKQQGFGRAAVVESLRSLQLDGVPAVGAVITDGNTASERLFTGLGFARIGAWG